MPRVIDLTGQRFGRLVVIDQAPKNGRITKWNCICDCGERKCVQAAHLRSGHTQSCGCYGRERNAASKTLHGCSSRARGETDTYKRWKWMHARVAHVSNYAHVSVCSRWISFEAFAADMGECPTGYSLERKDPLGNYEASNCCWIPRNQQPKNTRRTKRVTYGGTTMILSDWARSVGIKPNVLSKRLKSGWPIAQALGLEPRTPRAQGHR
jgi:hypothetical protein